jgi:hypothetical protein
MVRSRYERIGTLTRDDASVCIERGEMARVARRDFCCRLGDLLHNAR